MALPLVIANTVQVRIAYIYPLQSGFNVLHAIVPSGFLVTQTVTNTLGSAIKTAFSTNLAAVFSTTCGIAKVTMRDIRQPNQAEFIDAAGSVFGIDTAEPLPPSVAVVVTLRTALSGKSNRGRVYLSGFSETASDINAQASGAAHTAATNFLAAIDTAMDASQMTLAVASRPAERYTIVKTTFHADGTSTADTIGKGNARPGASNAVTLIQTRTATFESQRRRTNSRGTGLALLGGTSTVTPNRVARAG